MKWYVDFSGYCEIEAEDEEGAEREFWRLISEDEPLPGSIFNIDDIELKEDE